MYISRASALYFKKLINIFFFILPLWSNVYPQVEPENFVVDSIRIIGNEITEEYIILRELTFDVGDTVNNSVLNFNRERVFSLGIFNRVELNKIIENNLNTVEISVHEAWYIYPVPFLNFDNNDIDKASFGMILLWKNFRGRNETVNLMASFGYDPKYVLSYYNPVISEEYDLSFRFSAGYMNINNKSLAAERIIGSNFSYKSYGIILGIGKRINQFNEFSISYGYEYIEQPDKRLYALSSSLTKIDRHPILKLNYFYDTRNLKQFSTEGIYTVFEFMHKGFGLNSSSYNILNLDFREYRGIWKELTGRWRFTARHLFGNNLPYYDKSFLGYREIVRGHQNDYREGDNLIKSSFEIVYPILAEWNFSIKLPLIPQKLTSMRIGINLETFVDAGTTFNNGERLNFNNFDSGYGFGVIILFLPHNAFRIELGFDEYKNTELLIGTGFSF